jgi:short-subunit dehydrogenase
MKYAVISGASRGLGRELAIQLHKNNYVVIAYARNINELNLLKEELLKENNTPVYFYKADASIQSEILQFAEEVKKNCTCPDVLINNVAQYEGNVVSEESFEMLEKQMNINFYSAWWLTQSFLSEFKKRKSGYIINICSVVCKQPRAEAASYSISKGALKIFNDVLKEEMNNYNVKVTAVLPGSINTSSWNGIDAPKSEFIQTSDIASLVLHILKNPTPANFDEILINPQLKGF